MRRLVMKSSKEILAEKMRLESQWNLAYLTNGKVTPDMNQIQELIKECRRELVKRDEQDARFEYKALDNLEGQISIAS
jgi:predicted AlkP superfamily phosphohydrolase/phosphomutase